MSTASSPKIKVGFVGLSSTGWASQVLAPSLIQPSLQNTYDIVAISTSSKTSSQASADKYSKDLGHPIKAYFGDASKIATDSDVNMVAIAVKAPYHRDVVLPVIEAKKDFFLEWPAGASLKETEEIAAAARKQGVRTIVGLQGRHSAVVRRAKELISSGAIGTVRSTNVLALIPREAHLWTPLSQEKDLYIAQKGNGASQLDIPIAHQLDTLTYVLGDFVSVTATDATVYRIGTVVDAEGNPTGKTYPIELPDHYVITGFLKDGIIANVFWRGGYVSTPGRRQFVWEIEGDDGVLRMDLNGGSPDIVEPDLFLNGEKIMFENPGNVFESLGIAWKEFAEGGPGSYATIEDAVKHHRLIEAIKESAENGKRITL